MSADMFQVIIKAPNQKILDQTIDCELNWTVLQLKTHLSNVYPNNPKIEDQKLIYGGQMLVDNSQLKDILKHEAGQKHTLHLVCASSNMTNSPSRNINYENDRTTNTNTTSQQGTPGTSLHYRGVRQNGENFANVSHTPGFNQFQMPAAGAPMNPEMIAQQMAAMQQFYAQYMAQIMQNAQMAGGFGTYPNFMASPGLTPAAGPVPVPPPGFTQAPRIPEAPNVPRANVNPGPAPVPNPNIRMNAQGGAVLDEDEDEVGERDWLDWFYIVCRAVVLFSVVYFYSSLSRFMVVFGLSILIYMYQGGWFGPRPVAGQQNQEANREDRAAAANQNEAGPHQEERENVSSRDNEENVSSPPNVSQPEVENEAQVQEEIREIQQLMDAELEVLHHAVRPEPTPMQLFWNCFTSFFTSMIPEQPPPPVNIN